MYVYVWVGVCFSMRALKVFWLKGIRGNRVTLCSTASLMRERNPRKKSVSGENDGFTYVEHGCVDC